MAKKSVAGTVDDPTIHFSELVVDGETYRLAYSFNSIALAEREAGCNLLAGLEGLGNLSAIQLRGLLWAAMKVAAPDIPIERAAALIRLDTMQSVTEALAKAYNLSMPEKKAEDPSEAEQPAQS